MVYGFCIRPHRARISQLWWFGEMSDGITIQGHFLKMIGFT